MPDIAATELDQIDDLLKGPTMLEETLERLYTEAIEKGLSKGMSQGLSQGLSQGQSQGACQMLTRMVVQRFGPLPDWALRRLQSADASQLERWADQLFTAPSLEALLVSPKQGG